MISSSSTTVDDLTAKASDRYLIEVNPHAYITQNELWGRKPDVTRAVTTMVSFAVTTVYHTEGSAQDCSNSIADTLELLPSYTKPSISIYKRNSNGTTSLTDMGALRRLVANQREVMTRLLELLFVLNIKRDIS